MYSSPPAASPSMPAWMMRALSVERSPLARTAPMRSPRSTLPFRWYTIALAVAGPDRPGETGRTLQADSATASSADRMSGADIGSDDERRIGGHDADSRSEISGGEVVEHDPVPHPAP